LWPQQTCLGFDGRELINKKPARSGSNYLEIDDDSSAYNDFDFFMGKFTHRTSPE